MDVLIDKSTKKIQQTELRFERYLSKEINWDRKLIGIKGARGTGKTTLLLQYPKKEIWLL